MASILVGVNLYDKTGTSLLEFQNQDTTTSISDVMYHWNYYHQDNQISAISDSAGGTALDESLQLGSFTGGGEGTIDLYDATPEPEPATPITGFMYNGTKYCFSDPRLDGIDEMINPDFYQEFVTTCHNAYLQDTENLTGLVALQEQINGNVEYYYNNLSAGGHIVENPWAIEQGLEGAVGVFDGYGPYTYDVISGQEIPFDEFDFNTHMGLYYGGVSGGENPDFGFFGGE